MNRFLLLSFLAGCINLSAFAQQPPGFGNLSGYPLWVINSPLPPEIDFSDKPRRILLAPLNKVEQLHVARDKKEELIKDCLDTFLQRTSQQMNSGIPQCETILLKDPFVYEGYPNDPAVIAKLLKDNQADLLFAIDQFRPSVEKAGVEVVETPGGSKDRTATYLISAGGVLRIYNTDSLLRNFSFYSSAFLKQRKVVSGLLAAGPSLVSNREEAIDISQDAARALVVRMCPGQGTYNMRKFSMKEFRQLNNYLQNEDNASAMAEALVLANSSSSKVRGRAYVMIALLKHKKGLIDEALIEIEKAIPLTDAGSPEMYRGYLLKYSSARLIKWK